VFSRDPTPFPAGLSVPGRTVFGMTTVHHPTPEQLRARKAAILARLGMTQRELRARVNAGGLVGDEWSAWSEIQDIDYLLGDDQSRR
jgi:hypothetical protein